MHMVAQSALQSRLPLRLIRYTRSTRALLSRTLAYNRFRHGAWISPLELVVEAKLAARFSGCVSECIEDSEDPDFAPHIEFIFVFTASILLDSCLLTTMSSSSTGLSLRHAPSVLGFIIRTYR